MKKRKYTYWRVLQQNGGYGWNDIEHFDLHETSQKDEGKIYSKSESHLNGLYWAEADDGNMLSFKTQDELYTFLNNQ